MTREMKKRIAENKRMAAELIRFANSRSKSRPSRERVTEILDMHIPYCLEKPAITVFKVVRYHKNPIQKSASFLVELSDGRTFAIDAYQRLRPQTPEEKEDDKSVEWPSDLFKIFYSEVLKEAAENA